MRIGVAGVGRIGAFHAATLCDIEDVESVVAAPAPGRAGEVAARLGVESVDSPDALFTAGLDGLVIAAGTHAHPELIVRGVDHAETRLRLRSPGGGA